MYKAIGPGSVAPKNYLHSPNDDENLSEKFDKLQLHEVSEDMQANFVSP